GYAGVQMLDSGFRLRPVTTELGFAAHGPLVAAQADFMLFEAGQGRKKAAVREGGKPRNAHVDANGAGGLRLRLLDFTLGLNADEPFAARLADGGIPGRAQHIAREAQTHPAELGKEDAAIARIELELLGVGVAKA